MPPDRELRELGQPRWAGGGASDHSLPAQAHCRVCGSPSALRLLPDGTFEHRDPEVCAHTLTTGRLYVEDYFEDY